MALEANIIEIDGDDMKRKGFKIHLFETNAYLVLILCFVASFFDTIYRRTENNDMAMLLFKVCILAIIIVCAVCILLNCRRLDLILIISVIFLFYEAMITFMFYRIIPVAFLIDAYGWPFIFLAAYYLGKRNKKYKITSKIVFIGTCLTIVLCIPNLMTHLYGVDMYGGVVGPIYYLLSYLGLVLLFCREKSKIFFMLLISILLIISTKRTGVLCAGIGIAGYYFCKAHISRGNEKYKKYATIILVSSLIIVFVAWYLQTHNVGVVTRFLNLKSDQGSGRVEAWTKVIEKYEQSRPVYKLFGHGFHTVQIQVRPLNREIFAHNSFLEALYDFGLIGMGGLIFIVLSMGFFTIKLIKEKHSLSPTLVYLFINAVLLSIIGGYYFDETRIIMTAAYAWGVICGIYTKESKENKRKALMIK